MKPSGQRWHLRNQHELNGFIHYVHEQWKQKNFPTVSFLHGDRTNNQNAMIHALYGDIARATEQTVLEVKRDSKLRYGVPILRAADPDFCALYDLSIKGNLEYGQKLVLMDYLPVTSEFTAAQASEYIDTLLSEYGGRGVALNDPRR